jgi:hypothetical protein
LTSTDYFENVFREDRYEVLARKAPASGGSDERKRKSDTPSFTLIGILAKKYFYITNFWTLSIF